MPATTPTLPFMVDIEIDGIAHGGEAVGRLDGKACFVAGAMPGERVEVDLTREKKRWARGRLVQVIDPSPDRVEPPCPAFGRCGGCQWQYASYERQLAWKHDVVEGQLRHLGGVASGDVLPTIAPGPSYGYRNRMDFSVVRGRPALHERRSDRLVPLDGCPLLRPELADLLATLEHLRGTRKIVLRSGVNTGDLLVLVDGRVPDAVRSWDASVVVRQHGALQTVRGRAWFEEEIDGVRLRVPAEAFFQVNTAGAETLVRLVAEAAGLREGDVLLDGYAGVGLFAATVGRAAERIITIDSGTAAFRAVERNLDAAVPGRHLALLGAFERTAPNIEERWDVAIVDPPRAGLGSSGVAAATRWGPRTVVLISCDPASLARDAGLLGAAGYALDWVQPVDLFPQTYHVETVTRFVRR